MGRRWFVMEQTLATGEVREVSRHWRKRIAQGRADTLNRRVILIARLVTVLPDVRYTAVYFVRSAVEIEQAGARL